MPDFFEDILASGALRRMESLWWFDADCHAYNCLQVPLVPEKTVHPFENTAPRRKPALAVTEWCPSSFLAFFTAFSIRSGRLYTWKKQSERSTQWGGQQFPSTSTASTKCLTKYVVPLGFFGRSNCDIAFDTCATQRGRNHLEPFVSLTIHQNIIKPPLDTFHVWPVHPFHLSSNWKHRFR